MTYDFIFPTHVYLAGPMKDAPMLNFPSFFRVQGALETLGVVVINPAELDILNRPHLCRDDTKPADDEMRDIIEEDVQTILFLARVYGPRAAIVTVPMCRDDVIRTNSIGMNAELALARWLNLIKISDYRYLVGLHRQGFTPGDQIRTITPNKEDHDL